MQKPQNWLNLSTKEIALVSIMSAVWITSQFYLGPVIGRATQMHGMVNRLVGWFLMLILAELTGKFGRVTMMSTIATLVTRTIRTSGLEATIVGMGYILGGLSFDLLFFFSLTSRLEGGIRDSYLLSISVVSGIVAAVPYLLWNLYLLDFYGFLIAWIPANAYRVAKDIILSALGGFTGLTILPRIKGWSLHSSK